MADKGLKSIHSHSLRRSSSLQPTQKSTHCSAWLITTVFNQSVNEAVNKTIKTEGWETTKTKTKAANYAQWTFTSKGFCVKIQVDPCCQLTFFVRVCVLMNRKFPLSMITMLKVRRPWEGLKYQSHVPPTPGRTTEPGSMSHTATSHNTFVVNTKNHIRKKLNIGS